MRQTATLILSQKVTTNQFYATHYMKRSAIKNSLYREMAVQVREQLRPVDECDLPLHTQYDFAVKGRTPDIDNVSAIVKIINDTLVHCKIIADDNIKYIHKQTILLSEEKPQDAACVVAVTLSH